MPQSKKKITIFTLGHSTHSLEDFIELIKQYGITHIIDIRTIARSLHNPQFNEIEFSKSLKKVHVKYTHMKELGGFRHTQKDSINTAWRNKSFRGFADYMQTDSFKKGIEKLINCAKHDKVAIMCAEAVPWRCHRSLIGDALLIRKIIVEDIYSLTNMKQHTLTAWAKVKEQEITYPDTDKSKKNSTK